MSVTGEEGEAVFVGPRRLQAAGLWAAGAAQTLWTTLLASPRLLERLVVQAARTLHPFRGQGDATPSQSRVEVRAEGDQVVIVHEVRTVLRLPLPEAHQLCQALKDTLAQQPEPKREETSHVQFSV